MDQGGLFEKDVVCGDLGQLQNVALECFLGGGAERRAIIAKYL